MQVVGTAAAALVGAHRYSSNSAVELKAYWQQVHPRVQQNKSERNKKATSERTAKKE